MDPKPDKTRSRSLLVVSIETIFTPRIDQIDGPRGLDPFAIYRALLLSDTLRYVLKNELQRAGFTSLQLTIQSVACVATQTFALYFAAEIPPVELVIKTLDAAGVKKWATVLFWEKEENIFRLIQRGICWPADKQLSLETVQRGIVETGISRTAYEKSLRALLAGGNPDAPL